MDESREGGEGGLAAGEEGVGGVSGGAGGALGQERGLLVGFHGFFFLRFKVLGVFLIMQGILWRGCFDVIRAIEELRPQREGEGV